MELDGISSLPNGVTEKILSLLLPWEAAKTSVLSTNWRYKWAMLQDLDFDESSWLAWRNQEVGGYYEYQFQTSFVDMISHVLLLHIGPVRMFKLKVVRDPYAIDVNRWVTHLSRNSIKELMLSFVDLPFGPAEIPSCVFSCQDLVCLELSHFVLKPPSTFKGFRSLKSLQLMTVKIDQNMLEILIRCSPLLERLALGHCHGVTNLKIHAPNLQYLSWMGQDFVNLESAFSITEAEVRLCDEAEYVDESWVPSSSCNLVKICDHLPNIRRLEIKEEFLKYLSLGVLPEKLPKPCEYLKVLSIDICFDDPDEIRTVLCILRSSPVLQKLEIIHGNTFRTRRPGVVEEQKDSSLEVIYNFTLPHLRLVKISNIDGVKAELDFIRFLLLSSPLLERMTVSSPSQDHDLSVDKLLKLVKALLQFKRESKHAEIIFLDSKNVRL